MMGSHHTLKLFGSSLVTRLRVVRTQTLLVAKLVSSVSKANRFSSSHPHTNGISVAFPSKPIALDDLKAEALQLKERVRIGYTLKTISKNEE